MMLFGDWAQRTADACRLLYSKSRHILTTAEKKCVTRNSYTLRKQRDIPQRLEEEEFWGLPFLPQYWSVGTCIPCHAGSLCHSYQSFFGALSRAQELNYVHLNANKAYLPFDYKYFNYFPQFSELNSFVIPFLHLEESWIFLLCFALIQMISSHTI